jgi:hypothetical protein
MRAFMSKGTVDLLAIHREHQPLMIQCKRTGQIGSVEWNQLYDLAATHGALPVLCFRSGPRSTAFMVLDAPREPRRPGRPWREIDPRDCSEVPMQLTIAA